MEDFEFKIGDLVRLRDDLEDGKIYGYRHYVKNMNFKGFKKIEKLCDDEIAIININHNDYHYTKEMIAKVKRPTKYETIYKREEPILDDVEKTYLGNIIKPFKDKVMNIAKITVNEEKEYISISLNNDTVVLPNFKRNGMYKNMEANKEYTLEKLGL